MATVNVKAIALKNGKYPAVAISDDLAFVLSTHFGWLQSYALSAMDFNEYVSQTAQRVVHGRFKIKVDL